MFLYFPIFLYAMDPARRERHTYFARRKTATCLSMRKLETMNIMNFFSRVSGPKHAEHQLNATVTNDCCEMVPQEVIE